LVFNNSGTSSDGIPGAANLDGYGFSYSAQQLAASGLHPGQPFTASGLTFTWPAAAPGALDNATALGQTVRFAPPATGTTVGFLGSASCGPSGGIVTITYTDGSTQSFKLAFSDWALGGNKNGQPIPGNTIVARMPYRNKQNGTAESTVVFVFYAGIGLQPGKTVASVTLPAAVNGGALHIFAMSVGTPSAAAP
jgi:hypothetical protein